MKALRFDFSIPRMLLTQVLGRLTHSAYFGPLSGLSLTDVPEPALPGADWARLEVLMCGICGSDVAGLTFKTSPVVEPFISLPSVLGHEVLARVVEVGPSVTRVKVGDRVSIDPLISCTVRGRVSSEQCSSCAAGFPATCAFAGEAGGPSLNGGPLARGIVLGANSDLPGGFGERIVAHDSQLFPVPDSIDDNAAVLTEPLSIGVHAILQSHHERAGAALVIGSGPIALGTVWALRALGHQGPIVAQTKRPNEAALARELGASDTPTPGGEALGAMLATGAKLYRPIIGPEVFAGGGFATVFDCVGSRESLDQALRFVAPHGKIVLLGCAGEIGDLDLTFLWAREIQLTGFVGYGIESWRGERLHTFEVTHRLIAESGAPLGKLVSHSFPLACYRTAFRATARRSVSRALKVLLTPN
jgi:L-iditol 2-dehydrogenase